MSSPLSFLVENEKTVLTAYRQSNSKPGNAWDSLKEDLPQLSRVMTFNTFKQYVSVFAFVKNELDKGKQKKQVRQKLDKKPRRICGWSLQHSKDGYYRCYRKINNRVHSVYLGKELDVNAAENRIKAKEKSLGLV